MNQLLNIWQKKRKKKTFSSREVWILQLGILASKIFTQTEKHTHFSAAFPLCPRRHRSNAYVETVDTSLGLPNTDRHSFIIILAATNTGRTTATAHT